MDDHPPVDLEGFETNGADSLQRHIGDEAEGVAMVGHTVEFPDHLRFARCPADQEPMALGTGGRDRADQDVDALDGAVSLQVDLDPLRGAGAGTPPRSVTAVHGVERPVLGQVVSSAETVTGRPSARSSVT